MNTIRIFLTGGSVLLFACLAFAQTEKIENFSAQAASVTEFEVNGLKVLVRRRVSAPTVAAGLFIRGGSQNVDTKTAGIENLMLKVAVESSKKYPRQLLRRELSRTASALTTSTTNDYSVIALVSTRQNFDTSWNVFADAVMNPTFASEDVERDKQAVLTGLRSGDDDPDSALDTFQERIVYAGHPYSNDPSGTIATVESFTGADLAAYHKKVMETSRLLLVVVGDIDPAELKSRVEQSFGKLPRGAYKPQPLPGLDFSKASLDVSSRSIPTNYIEGVFSAPPLTSPDYYPMTVAITMLRDRVFEEVRVKRNLSYAPSASMATMAANSANIYVTAVDANQSVSVMLDQIKQLQTQSVDQSDIAGQAGQFLTTYYLSQETNVAQAGELARYELVGGGWRNAFEFLNRIRAVKPEDVKTVANKYMKNIRFVVIGNPAAINKAVFLPAE